MGSDISDPLEELIRICQASGLPVASYGQSDLFPGNWLLDQLIVQNEEISMSLAVRSNLSGKEWKRGVSAGMPDDKVRREPDEITGHMQMQGDNTRPIPSSLAIS